MVHSVWFPVRAVLLTVAVVIYTLVCGVLMAALSCLTGVLTLARAVCAGRFPQNSAYVHPVRVIPLWHGAILAVFRICLPPVTCCVPGSLSRTGRYVLIANHQSWVDVILLEYALFGRVPLTRYVMKHSLRYIPIVGQAFVLMGMPFLKRRTLSEMRHQSSKRAQDHETLRQSVLAQKEAPFTLATFVEGTRFTDLKHRGSRYKHLLSPKVGSLATILETTGPDVTVLDATLAYPPVFGRRPSAWDFMCGRVVGASIDIQVAPLPMMYETQKRGDKRVALRDWLDDRWDLKDQRLQAITDSLTRQTG